MGFTQGDFAFDHMQITIAMGSHGDSKVMAVIQVGHLKAGVLVNG